MPAQIQEYVMPSQCTINGTKYELVEEERFKDMEAMIRSAFAVADRKGRNTDWRRFKAALEELAVFGEGRPVHTYWNAGPAYPAIVESSTAEAIADPAGRFPGETTRMRLAKLEKDSETVSNLLHKWFDEKTEIKNDFDKLELRVHALESGGIIDFIGEDTLKDLKDRIQRLEAFPCVGHTDAKKLATTLETLEEWLRSLEARIDNHAARMNGLQHQTEIYRKTISTLKELGILNR